MLHTHLPQPLRRPVVQQLESNGRLKLVKLVKRERWTERVRRLHPSKGGAFFFGGTAVSHLSGSDLDVEVVPLVGDLEDLWPREPVDPEPVSVDQQTTAAHAQHDGHTLRVLHTTQPSLISRQDGPLSGRTEATDQHDKHANVDVIPHHVFRGETTKARWDVLQNRAKPASSS